MNSLQPSAVERLYALLPTLYQVRDFEQGEPLRALLQVLEEELVVVETDVARLYNNWFIETCDEWVIPYLGELVSAKLVHPVHQRAFIANTLAYRRRKGTVQTLAGVARDVTGWPARMVEYLPLVIVSQHLSNPRLNNFQVPIVRNAEVLERCGTPFETVPHTVDVRRRGRYHPSQIGLQVFRRDALPLYGVRAAQVSPGCFRVNPACARTELWSSARSRPDLLSDIAPGVVPQPLRRDVLYRALERRRQKLAEHRIAIDPFFDNDPVLLIKYQDESGALYTVLPEEIVIADLGTWWRPPATLEYGVVGQSEPVSMPIKLALDPELGRISFPEGVAPSGVWTSYYEGSGGEIGGGGYARSDCDATVSIAGQSIQVSGGALLNQTLLSLGQPSEGATSLWAATSTRLTIEIVDSDIYPLGPIYVPAGATLEIRARSGQRPMLVPIGGQSVITYAAEGTLRLNGVFVQGCLSLELPSSGAARTALMIRHATLIPSPTVLASGEVTSDSINMASANLAAQRFVLTLDRAISGIINLPQSSDYAVVANDSIIDNAAAQRSQANLPLSFLIEQKDSQTALCGGAISLSRVTVFGGIIAATISDTTDSLLCGWVVTQGGPVGGVSYCYLPQKNRVLPMPYACQPDAAMAESTTDPLRVERELKPLFVSRKYGAPGYAQLSPQCSPLFRMGASDGGELGAFHSLEQARKEANLIGCQDGFLGFGLTLNLFFAT